MYFPNKALDVHSQAKMAFLAYFFRYLMGIKRLFYGAGPTLEKPYVSCQTVLVLLMAKESQKSLSMPALISWPVFIISFTHSGMCSSYYSIFAHTQFSQSAVGPCSKALE